MPSHQPTFPLRSVIQVTPWILPRESILSMTWSKWPVAICRDAKCYVISLTLCVQQYRVHAWLPISPQEWAAIFFVTNFIIYWHWLLQYMVRVEFKLYNDLDLVEIGHSYQKVTINRTLLLKIYCNE